MKAVAILGAGPAGLLAAHAAALAGQPVVILSYGKKSKLGGAQFLHEPIPELTDDEPDVLVTYRRSGWADQYQFKAYGSGPQPMFVSFDGVQDELVQPGWNLRKMYDRLWDTYGSQITETEVTSHSLPGILADDLFSMVVCTVPAPHLCRRPQMTTPDGHRFQSQHVIIQNGKCHGGHEENTIWYDGSRDHSWYRASRLWGVESTEWGAQAAAMLPYPLENQVRVQKPLFTNCDCWPESDKLHKAGRFGRWQKGVLVHDGFRSTLVAMHSLGLFELPDRVRP